MIFRSVRKKLNFFVLQAVRKRSSSLHRIISIQRVARSSAISRNALRPIRGRPIDTDLCRSLRRQRRRKTLQASINEVLPRFRKDYMGMRG